MASRECISFHKAGASTTLEGQRGERLKIAGCSLHSMLGTSNHASSFQMLSSRKMDLEIKYDILKVIYYHNLHHNYHRFSKIQHTGVNLNMTIK